MSKHLFANEQVMKQYLSALLTEEVEAPAKEPAFSKRVESRVLVEDLTPVAKLLEKVTSEVVEHVEAAIEEVVTLSEPVQKVQVPEVVAKPKESAKDLENHENTAIIKEQAVEQTQVARTSDYFDGEFQALFFEVAGLTLAVPLKALGGIHQLGDINQLFGKPKWFQGVMLNREQKLSVIDTARWVMPEKYTPELAEKLQYQYLIMLGDSNWGLSAEKLVNNITLQPDDVKWRTSASKRPWLAGVIKEKMCALIDVDNLIYLLEKGLDSREL
jgi:purine-binding chemotaxis protein CheW